MPIGRCLRNGRHALSKWARHCLLVSMRSIENAAVLRWIPYADECSPMEVHFEEKKRAAFCGCKQTKTPPFRDGSHLRI